MKILTCEQFADQLNNSYFFSEMIDEAYWNQHFVSEIFFDSLKTEAIEQDIGLSDTDGFDYDGYFSDLYDSSEKGLS